jgi:hypothetical protein
MARSVLLPAAISCLLLAACGGGGGGGGRPPEPDFREGFESGLAGWTKGADVPQDPNRPGETVAWSIEVSAEEAFEGSSSARYDLDGTQDDGTIWLVRSFDADPGLHDVRLALRLWSESESFNTLARVAAYAGPVAPAVEADFDTSETANQVAGWREYAYDFVAEAGGDGRIHVALGISATWETLLTYYVDDVRVTID